MNPIVLNIIFMGAGLYFLLPQIDKFAPEFHYIINYCSLVSISRITIDLSKLIVKVSKKESVFLNIGKTC